MRYIFIILILALIIKDSSYLGDRFVLRGISQGLCLAVGSFWILTHISPALFRRYWAHFSYLFVLFISSLFSHDPFYSLFQVVSLAAVILFIIAYSENTISRKHTDTPFVIATLIGFGLVLIASLIALKVNPGIVYDEVFGGAKRFRGVFGEPAMMGTAAGLVFGFSMFYIKRIVIKVPLMTISVICISLTLSRTFWIATLFAFAVTIWFYKPKFRKLAIVGIVTFTLVGGAISFFNVTVDTHEAEKYARVESFTTLTGRTDLWAFALTKLQNSPLLGFGYTLGAEAALDNSRQGFSDTFKGSGSHVKRGSTLHSGYVQALLDSGILGFLLYMFIIIKSWSCLYFHDRDKNYAIEFFTINFLIVANVAESIIYSGSVYTNMIFWIVSIFAIRAQIQAERRPDLRRRFAGVDSNPNIENLSVGLK